MRRLLSVLACVTAIAVPFLGASIAHGAPGDPIFEYVPAPPKGPLAPRLPPPTARFYGPCGVAVDTAGRFYVSDYYHDVVDVFAANHPDYTNPSETGAGYITQLKGVDAEDGPCGLALDASNNLYVNDYHRSVIKYGAQPAFGTGTSIAGHGVDEEHPTGVAVDRASGNTYVDNRDHVAVYGSSGNQVDLIGEGSLEDGYGIAISSFPATAGYLYVPDTASNTIKVYDPSTDKDTPIEEIDGTDIPAGHFTSLRDAAIAVDDVTGEIYVIDNTQPLFTEAPQAIVQVFDSTGAWKGNLKYKVTDGMPSGLAVDNSGTATQSRVYVTSGNTDKGGIYAYPPGSALKTAPLTPKIAPPAQSSTIGGALSSLSQSQGEAKAPSAEPTASASVVTQQDNLRLSVNGRVSPQRLPRTGGAPIAVSVDWNLASTDGSEVPKLKDLQIEINRNGRFDATGLPVCAYPKIQPASTSRALSGCRSSVVGKGSVQANVALEGQETYPATGKLTIFNGIQKGKPVLYGHIYSARPFAISFVIVFNLTKKAKGTYGTIMSATLPRTLRNWGNLTALEMTLQRRYHYKGQSRSFVTASCAAPRGINKAAFPLARASFDFEGAAGMSSVLNDTCTVRG